MSVASIGYLPRRFAASVIVLYYNCYIFHFFVNNRIIQLLVANRLLINYLSIYLSILLGKNIARKCIFHSVKNRPKIPIFSTFINNEILRNFEGKNHRLVQRILEEVYYTSVKPYCCSTTYEKSRLGN